MSQSNKITTYFQKTPERMEAGMTSPMDQSSDASTKASDGASPKLSRSTSKEKTKQQNKKSPTSNSSKAEKVSSNNPTPISGKSNPKNSKAATTTTTAAAAAAAAATTTTTSAKKTPTTRPNAKSTPKQTSDSTPKSTPPISKDLTLPTYRIKMIMKSCPDVESVPQETLFVVTRATELFIQFLAVESLASASSCAKLDYDALSKVVHQTDFLDFLKETIPKKITWAQCQKLMEEKSAQMDQIM